MKIKIVCLANSLKEGGKCLAGIELNENNTPKIENNRPKWIRPICKTEHGQIPALLIAEIGLLDIMEIDITKKPEITNYQSENYYFSENSIKKIGRFDFELLSLCHENKSTIFGNRGKALPKDVVEKLTYSLILIKVKKYCVEEKVYEDNPANPKTRLLFTYNNVENNFPVTDPIFLYNYKHNPNLLNGCTELYLTISLTVEWKGWYYKLVSGIIWK